MILQVIAIIILLLFYGCYFAKMISQKKKGIQTNQMGKGKTGVIKLIELTMKAASLIVPIIEIISIGINFSSLPFGARVVGAVVAILGVIAFICAVITMRDSWRAGVSKSEQTALVTTGIYEISRNPAFLGFDLVYIGILLMFFNWLLFAASVFAVLTFHLQIINVEEEFLLEAFGDSYLKYRKNVNRYLGRRIGK